MHYCKMEHLGLVIWLVSREERWFNDLKVGIYHTLGFMVKRTKDAGERVKYHTGTGQKGKRMWSEILHWEILRD